MQSNPKLTEIFKNLFYNYLSLPSFKNIEIEARLGQITNVITKRRIDYHTDHPIIFTRLPHELFFSNGVDKNDFTAIKKAIVQGNETVQRSDTITISNGLRRIEYSGEVRYERKKNIKRYDIYLPELRYDVRVSVSSEEEVPQVDKAVPKEFISTKNSITRLRSRESYLAGALSYDFTKVGRKSQDIKEHEVELEVKDPENGIGEFISALFSLSTIKR